MAANQPPSAGGDFEDEGFTGYAAFSGEDAAFLRRRKLMRYGVPVVVAGVAAATIGLGTALATTGGNPSLPHRTAEQLLAKVAASDVQTVSGSVRVTTDLGVPGALLGAATGSGAAAFGQQEQHGGHGGKDAPGADPRAHLTELLSGSHTLRIAADGPDRQRVSLLEGTAQYTVIHNGTQVWAYDSGTNSVQHATRPAAAGRSKASHGPDELSATPQEAARQALKAVGPTTSVTVDGTAQVAGRDAYELKIAPKQSGSTVGAIRIAVDASNGAPLAFTLSPAGGGKPVVDIAYTSVDFGRPSAGEFSFTAPKGAHVTEDRPHRKGYFSYRPASPKSPAPPKSPAAPGMPGLSGLPGLGAGGGPAGFHVVGTGWTAVAELNAPSGRSGHGAPDPAGMLGALGKPVKGSFGSGTVIGTRLVNVLVTRDGGVFAGAVTPQALVRAADAAARSAE